MPVGLNMNEAFERVLGEAIDEALCSLGESVKTSIYFHLKAGFQLEKHEIPSRIEDFSAALNRIFGLGSQHLEELCVKKLHAKTGLPDLSDNELQKSSMTLQEHVALIEQAFEEAESRRKANGVSAYA